MVYVERRARRQYGIQGWKKAKIYPDFIFAVHSEGKAKRITVLETKGDRLDNLDTAYKRELLGFLSGAFQWDDYTAAGQLELVKNTGETVRGTLILERVEGQIAGLSELMLLAAGRLN